MRSILAAVIIVGCCAHAYAQSSWKRTRMAQGYYAAYVANATGAEFRARCRPSADGDRSEVQSVSYVPKARLTEMKKVQGSITIDGSPRRYTFAAQRDPMKLRSRWGGTIWIRWKA